MRRLTSVVALAISLAGIGAGGQTAFAQATRDSRIADFVKAGTIRVAFGMNPTLAVKDTSTGQLHGPALELARALTKRMGVELIPVEYPSPGAVLQGIDTKAWDLTFLVIDPGRAKVVDFSPPYMQSDFTYLVSADAAMRTVADVDRPEIRVAVVHNDASDLYLTRLLKQAVLVRADDIDAAVELVHARQADAAAAPRPVVLVQSAKVGGTRILDDGFADISYAAVVPKGSSGLLAYISEFIEEAKVSGLVKQTIESAGLRGIRVAPSGNPNVR